MSIKTIGTYHTRILEKMNMNSDVELTRYALQNKLVGQFFARNLLRFCLEMVNSAASGFGLQGESDFGPIVCHVVWLR